MTNRDIEDAAVTAYGYIGPDFGQTLVDAMRSLVLEAYDDAARTMCGSCASGTPLVRGHFSGNACTTDWKHSYEGANFPCLASAIHSLKESLVQETVSS